MEPEWVVVAAPEAQGRATPRTKQQQEQHSPTPSDHSAMAALPWTLLFACLFPLHTTHRGGPDGNGSTEAALLLDLALPEATTAVPLAATLLPYRLPNEVSQPEGEGSAEKVIEEHQSSSEEEEGDHGQGCRKGLSPKNMSEITHAMMMFATDLLREMERENGEDNIFFSPLSVSLALAHLALGAANQTEKQLLEALRVELMPCIHQALHGMSQHLSKTALSIAARIYLEKGFLVKEKFLEDSERFYGAKPASLSGNNEADLAAINNWVKEATNGQISTMLSDLPANTVMLLLNAVHFQGFWETKFDPNLTEPRMFHLDDEFTVSVEMMKAQMLLSWFSVESLDIQVARFPFKGNTTLVVLLPNHVERNFSRLLPEFHKVNGQTAFPKERPTSVMMPKLHLQYHLDLNQALSHLGLGELFSSPNLRPIAEGPLFVSSIQHRAALELSEAGVEASAATSVAMSRSRSDFHLNRPFLFIIKDFTGIPLFLGSIRNPEPSAPKQGKTKDCVPISDGESSLVCAKDPEKL
ncbi:alpha-2-antiplasmin isoform X2 [Elgaria multicarinata webbii]|uniref:alpha-2-antiplasmin isoform X2 n=1 Tax=Elgaria multicarinata webbii TaxID=159646 RepID=UPI002FCD4329